MKTLFSFVLLSLGLHAEIILNYQAANGAGAIQNGITASFLSGVNLSTTIEDGFPVTSQFGLFSVLVDGDTAHSPYSFVPGVSIAQTMNSVNSVLSLHLTVWDAGPSFGWMYDATGIYRQDGLSVRVFGSGAADGGIRPLTGQFSTVPEPSTGWMLFGGFLMLAGVRIVYKQRRRLQ